MSKGSKIVPVRIPDRLFAELVAALKSQNYHTREEPLTLSGWVRKCVIDKLNHLERGKKRKKKQSFEKELNDAYLEDGIGGEK